MTFAPIFPKMGNIYSLNNCNTLLEMSSHIFEYMKKNISIKVDQCSGDIFYQALQYPFIQEYVGLSNYNIYSGNDIKEFEYKLNKGSLKCLKYDKLEYLFIWLYGNDNIESVIHDKEDLEQLNMILFSSESMNVMEKTNDLNCAYESFME